MSLRFRSICFAGVVATAVAIPLRCHAAAKPGAPSVPRSHTAAIPLGPTETIVFFGDSITQQNLYTAYIETFLISRFPAKQLLFWNAGIGGNTVDDALARFDRDVAPLKPTIVIVNFGMNDGKYVPPNVVIKEHYADGLGKLVAKIKGIGARPILCTPPAVNKHHAMYLESYNETLAGLAQAVQQVGSDQGTPVIDLFTAYRPFAEQANPDPLLVPDGVHPNEAGHLLLAAAALSRFDAPGPLGSVVINGRNVTGNKLIGVRGVAATQHGLSFEIQLSHHPFYIPASAHLAGGVSFQNGLNAFTLQIKGWPANKTLLLSVDGEEVAVVPVYGRKQIDLSSLVRAKWNQNSATLWREAQSRFERQSMSWRAFGIDASAFTRSLPATAAAQQALHAWAIAAGLALRSLVTPASYHVQVQETDEVFVQSLELSPTYPFDLSALAFERQDAPETDPASVAWRRTPVVDRAVDLEEVLGHPKRTLVYARLVLKAQTAGELAVELGSNDGLSVFVNGKRVLARNVSRPLKLGDDSVVVSLTPGQNTLLFRVTQHELRHGLALKLRAIGDLQVQQVVP